MALSYNGLDDEQLDDLTTRVQDLLPEPWHKPPGCPRKLTLRERLPHLVYQRQNIVQEVLAEWWDASQTAIYETTVSQHFAPPLMVSRAFGLGRELTVAEEAGVLPEAMER